MNVVVRNSALAAAALLLLGFALPALHEGAERLRAGVPMLRSDPADEALRCRIRPGPAHLLMHVERDTMLPLAQVRLQLLSASGVRPGPQDSLLAEPDSPMPTGLVRLLDMDEGTRRALTEAGVTDAEPRAIVQARPYRADCRTVRWAEPEPWIQSGDTGYARATLADPEHWIDGTPVFVVVPPWSYPYPRYLTGTGTGMSRLDDGRVRLRSGEIVHTLASAATVFDFEAHIWTNAVPDRVIAWSAANLAEAELEPVRSKVRTALLGADFRQVTAEPSRLRGTYRVTMTGGDTAAAWYFRTMDRPMTMTTLGWDEARSTADVLAAPHVSGYSLIGYGEHAADRLPTEPPRPEPRERRAVWFTVSDRPTTSGAEQDSILRAQLQFIRRAAPESVWAWLDAFIPPRDPNLPPVPVLPTRSPRTEADDQPVLPLALRVAADGQIRADTTFTTPAGPFRVIVERVDTVSVHRPGR